MNPLLGRWQIAETEHRFFCVVFGGIAGGARGAVPANVPSGPLSRVWSPRSGKRADEKESDAGFEGAMNLQQFCTPPEVRKKLSTGRILCKVAVAPANRIRSPLLSRDVLRASGAVDNALRWAYFPGPETGEPSFDGKKPEAAQPFGVSVAERHLCLVVAWLVLGGAEAGEERGDEKRRNAAMLSVLHGNGRGVCATLVYMTAFGPVGSRTLAEALLKGKDREGNTLMHFLAAAGEDALFMRIVNSFSWFARAEWDVPNVFGLVPTLCLIRAMKLRNERL